MTIQPLFPKPLPPLQFERVVGFRDHTAPPSTPEAMQAEAEEFISWGWTDIVCGVTNVVGSSVRLLTPKGGQGRASALSAWQRYFEVLVKNGIRVHASFWHKPAWHQDLLVLTPLLARMTGSMLSTVIWDIEGETLNVSVKFDHKTAGSDIRHMRAQIKSEGGHRAPVWGVTVQIGHMQRAPRRVRPYLLEAEWNLMQVLGFENAKRSMGVKNPATLPGFFHEQAIDLLDSAYAWLAKHCHTTVLIAAYWQHIEGVDTEDVVGAACSSLLAAGRRDVGVFSAMWMRREGEVVRELVRRSDVTSPRAVPVKESQPEPEMVFTVDEVALDQLGFDALTRPTMTSPRVTLSKEEAQRIWDACERGYGEQSWRFPARDYELLLHAVRSESRTPGTYDDLLYVCRKVGERLDGWVVAFNCDPSPKYLVNPVRMARNRGGAAILCHPQQITNYVHAPHMGKVRGSLCQYKPTGPVDVWRDGNRDRVLDLSGPAVRRDRGMFGINLHRGGAKQTGSAGCQTYPPALWQWFEGLFDAQDKHVGPRSYSYAITSEEMFRTWL